MDIGFAIRPSTRIMAIRGKPVVTLTNELTVLHAPSRGEHSAKPKEFYDLVERLCPAPRYVDFFSRYQHSDKWDTYGDQAPLAASPPASPDLALPEDGSIPGFLKREVAP